MTSLCETGFLNCTQIIGQVIQSATETTTGSLYLTFLFIILLLVVIGMIFRIEFEYITIVTLPLFLALMSYYQQFLALGSVIFIYLGILITKNFIIK